MKIYHRFLLPLSTGFGCRSLLLDGLPVELEVNPGRSLPREVCCHGILNQSLPVIRRKKTDRPFIWLNNSASVNELESIFVRHLANHDRIVQPPWPDHDRPVLQAIDLIQAAGLILMASGRGLPGFDLWANKVAPSWNPASRILRQPG
jgi:hypothetical protein